MRAHYLQHVPFEGLGSIEPWLIDAGYTITSTHLFETAEFPEPDDFDLLVVMGGPMSINDEAVYPWLTPEKRFLRQVMETGKPVLGICLGAQLIAGCLGAKIFPNEEKEIGWFPSRGGCRSGRVAAALSPCAHRLSLARRDLRPAPWRGPSGEQHGMPEPGLPDR